MSSEKWLIRTEKNQILGPFTREKTRQMVLDGELGLRDEVCRGNSYWIYLHEDSEMRTQLDVALPKVQAVHSEDESTETEILSIRWGSDTVEDSGPPSPAPEGTPQDSDIPEILGEGETIPADSTVMSNRAFRAGLKRRAGEEVRELFQVTVKSAYERPQMWRWAAIVLGCLFVGLLLAMIWLLRG